MTTAPTVATPPEPTRSIGRGLAALARCVGDPDRFLTEHLGVAPHRWRSAGFEDLLSLADVDAQLTGSGLRRPAIRLVRDGQVLDPTTWTRRARSGSTWIDDLAHPARTLALFDAGATIVLQSLQRWWPPLTRFCRELEAALGHPAQANAYLTPRGSAGLNPHHDTHDVLVLQVHGNKHWTVREPAVEAPLDRHRSDHAEAARQPILFEADLEPGDCVYLPRGYIHSAGASETTSLHITIGVLAVTRHDLVGRVVDRTAAGVAFRRSLPVDHVADRQAAERVLKEVVADLVDWLTDLDVAELAADLIDRESRRRLPLLDGQLLDMADLAGLDDSSSVVHREGAPWRITFAGERVTLALHDRRLDLPAELEPALRRLLDGSAHLVGELTDVLDETSRLVLVRRLLREGVLRTVRGT